MPETINPPAAFLAVIGLLMLLGGCVNQGAVAPETRIAATPASAPPTTSPSANAPASTSAPQSAAVSGATKPSTLPLNDVLSPPDARSKSSGVAASSSKLGAAEDAAKNVPPASAQVSPSARAIGSGVASQPATATPPTPSAPKAAALDLPSLEQRLRDTHAIGIFTKLSLKNQVDDLLTHFKSFHQGQVPPTLPELRHEFELLLTKVVTVLEDGDAPLATAVSTSREALWSVLSDPQKFAHL